MNICRIKKKVTNRDAPHLSGVKDSRTFKIIKEMMDKGITVKHGKLKGSYYILNKIEEREENE